MEEDVCLRGRAGRYWNLLYDILHLKNYHDITSYHDILVIIGCENIFEVFPPLQLIDVLF